MSEKIPNRVRSIRNWQTPDIDALSRYREDFVARASEEWIGFFRSRNNQRAWNLSIKPTTARAMADMLGAFELGAHQVYSKMGYSADEIEVLQSYRFFIGKHDLPSSIDNGSIGVIFAYDANKRFLIDIPRLLAMAESALGNDGYSPYIIPELNQDSSREMLALELCELAGVEEAAHSLFHEHHPDQYDKTFHYPERSDVYNHFIQPVENAALKWKRNYILRFMPDFAQGFAEFEEKMSSGAI